MSNIQRISLALLALSVMGVLCSCSSAQSARDYDLVAPEAFSAPDQKAFDKAKSLLQGGDTDGARIILEDLEQRQPPRSEPRLLLALAYWKGHECGLAAQRLRAGAALGSDPQQRDFAGATAREWTATLLGSDRVCGHESGTAIETLLPLLGEPEPGSERGLAFGLYRKASSLAREGRCDQALLLFSQARRLVSPDFAQAAGEIDCLLRLGEDDRALALAKALTEKKRLSPFAIFRLAGLAEERFRPVASGNLLQLLVEQGKTDPGLRYLAASDRLQAGDPAAALAQLKSFTAEPVGTERAVRLYQSFILLRKHAAWTEALWAVKELDSLFKDRSEAMEELLSVMTRAGKKAEAAELLSLWFKEPAQAGAAPTRLQTLLAGSRLWVPEGAAILEGAGNRGELSELLKTIAGLPASKEAFRKIVEQTPATAPEAELRASLLCAGGFRQDVGRLLAPFAARQQLSEEGISLYLRCGARVGLDDALERKLEDAYLAKVSGNAGKMQALFSNWRRRGRVDRIRECLGRPECQQYQALAQFNFSLFALEKGALEDVRWGELQTPGQQLDGRRVVELWRGLQSCPAEDRDKACAWLGLIGHPGVHESLGEFFLAFDGRMPRTLGAVRELDQLSMILNCYDKNAVPELERWINGTSELFSARRQELAVSELLRRGRPAEAAELLVKNSARASQPDADDEIRLLPFVFKLDPVLGRRRLEAVRHELEFEPDKTLALASALIDAGAVPEAGSLLSGATIPAEDGQAQCMRASLILRSAAPESVEERTRLEDALVERCDPLGMWTHLSAVFNAGDNPTVARLSLRYLLAKEPRNDPGILSLGYRGALAGGAQETKAFAEALNRAKSPALLAAAAWNMAAEGELERAGGILDRALRMNPASPELLRMMLRLRAVAAMRDLKLAGADAVDMVEAYLSGLDEGSNDSCSDLLSFMLDIGLTREASAVLAARGGRLAEACRDPMIEGRLQLLLGRQEDAVKLYVEAIRTSDESSRAARRACLSLRQAGWSRLCPPLFKAAVERRPLDSSLLLAAAGAYLDEGMEAEAAEALRQALRVDEASFDKVVSLQEKMRDPELLLPPIRDLALSDSTRSTKALRQALKVMLLENLDAQVPELLRLLAAAKGNYLLVQEKAEVLFELGYTDEAFAMLRKLGGDKRLTLGLHLLAVGKTGEGLRHIGAFLNNTMDESQATLMGLDGSFPDPVMKIFLDVIEIIRVFGNRNAALLHLEKILEKNPTNAAPLLDYVAASAMNGAGCQESLELYAKALNMKPAEESSEKLSQLTAMLHVMGCGPGLMRALDRDLASPSSAWWLRSYLEEALRQEPASLAGNAKLMATALGLSGNAEACAVLNRAGFHKEAFRLAATALNTMMQEQARRPEQPPAEEEERDEAGYDERERDSRIALEAEMFKAATLDGTLFLEAMAAVDRVTAGLEPADRELELALIQERLGNAEEAAAHLGRAIQLGDRGTDRLLALFRLHLQSGSHAQALSDFHTAALDGPTGELVASFAEAAATAREHSLAIKILDEGLLLHPSDQALLFQKLRSLLTTGDDAPAAEVAGLLLSSRGGSGSIYCARLAEEAYGKGRIRLASSLCGALRNAELAQAGAFAQAVSDPEAAVKQLEQGLGLSRDRNKYLLQSLYRGLLAGPYAWPLLRTVQRQPNYGELSKNPIASCLNGLVLLEQGRTKSAAEALLSASRGLPAKAVIVSFVLFEALQRGLPAQEAEKLWQVYFHGVERRDALAFVMNGFLSLFRDYYEKQGLKKNTVEFLMGKIRALRQENPTDQWLAAQEAELLASAGRNEEALAVYSRGLELSPNDPGFMNNYAYSLALLGKDLEKAHGLVEKALNLDPTLSVFYLDTLGWIQFRQGQTDKAARNVRAALSRSFGRASEGMSEALYHMGAIELARDRRNDAVMWLNAAVAEDPQSPYARMALELLGRSETGN